EREHLASLVVHAERTWCAGESLLLKVPKQCVHRGSPGPRRPTDGVGRPDDRGVRVAAGEKLLVLATANHAAGPASCSTRAAARSNAASSKRYGVAFATSCAGPSSESEPVAPFNA